MASNAAPDRLTALELEAWSGLLSTHATLVRELDWRLRSEHGMPFRVYDVLATLDMTRDRRLRMSQLADRLVLSPSRLTRVVAELEREGWIERRADDADARAALALLTSSGLAALRRARRTHHAVIREGFLGRLREPDLRTLARIWRRAGTTDPGLDEALSTMRDGG